MYSAVLDFQLSTDIVGNNYGQYGV